LQLMRRKLTTAALAPPQFAKGCGSSVVVYQQRSICCTPGQYCRVTLDGYHQTDPGNVWFGNYGITIVGPVFLDYRQTGSRNSHLLDIMSQGCAIAQAVCPKLPTAATQIGSQVKCGQNGTGRCFLRVLQFPLPVLIPPTASHSQSC
jgi:hypothetical protein